MTTFTAILGLLTVLAIIPLAGFGCVASAGEGIHNVDAPMLLRVVQVATGALLLLLCTGLTYLLVTGAIESWKENE